MSVRENATVSLIRANKIAGIEEALSESRMETDEFYGKHGRQRVFYEIMEAFGIPLGQITKYEDLKKWWDETKESIAVE